MTQALDSQLDRRSTEILGIFRIVIGLLFGLHGSAKLFGWPATQNPPVPVGTWPYWWAGVIELVVGVLLITGLVARVAALLGSGAMAFAYFTEHQPNGFWPIQNGGELAVLYCFALLLIAFAGTGAFALGNRRPR